MHFKGFFNKGVLGKTVSETAGVYNTPYAGQRYVTNSDKSSLTETPHVWSSLRKRGSRANNTASFVGDIFPNKSALSQCRYDSALGRSMIEMLGVLAIIGVLSIAAVAGYRFALLKFRANEVTNELNMRAINVSAQMLNTGTVYEKNELIEDGFGDTLTVGFPVETAISDRNTDYFEILVSDIPADLCRQILRDYENPIMILVNDVRYNADTTICDDETGEALNDMGFIYKNDLGTHEACSEKGYFDEEDFQCHCSGNTYLDIYTNDCLCPAGHVWSAGEGTCIESICPEGQFETLKNGCVPCSDDKTYTIATDERHKQLCEASTCGRIVVGRNCVNAVVNNCIKGESFRANNGTCVACNTTATSVSVHADYKDLCNACSGRIYASGYCFLENMCEKGTQFLYPNHSSGYMQCRSCSDTDIFNIQNGTLENEYCRACKNDSGQFNRTVVGNTCIKTLCDSGEFMGANGRCYTCSYTTKIAVNTGSGCTDTACGRTEVMGSDGKTYCQITNCPTDGTYANVDGSCYPCADTTPFKATKTQCAQCTQTEKLWLGTDNADGTATGYCMRPCTKGTNYPDGNGRYCIPCNGTNSTGVGSVGNTTVGAEYCAACNGYVSSGFCVLKSKCTDGSEFRIPGNWNYDVCRSCDLVDAVTITSDESDREKCLKCTSTPRFWNGTSCYRCDSPETPDVTSTDEEKSCRTCDEREVKDGKCILIQ